jgi:hypothetical protein
MLNLPKPLEQAMTEMEAFRAKVKVVPENALAYATVFLLEAAKLSAGMGNSLELFLRMAKMMFEEEKKAVEEALARRARS